MRAYSKILAAAVLLATVSVGSAVAADGYVTVPNSVGQIQDQVFRDALREYSPQYDSLSRGDQIMAYANIYKVLNNGQFPALSPQDSGMMNMSQVRTYSRPDSGSGNYSGMQYDPWADPSYNPYKEEFGILSRW